MANPQPHFLGQGPAFPPRIGADGRFAWSAGEDNIRESIRVILMTEPGERMMREEFGCGLSRFLFEPNTAATRQRIRDAVLRSLTRWEPRITLDDVLVETDSETSTEVRVGILFRLVATQEPGRFGLTLQLEG
jgi:phage baseplate assembly protein W